MSVTNVCFYSEVFTFQLPVSSWLPRGVLCYPCGCSPRAPARQAGSDVAAVRGGAICATTKRRDVVSREIPLPRTHVVIWSKQKRKKRQACHPKKKTTTTKNRHIFSKFNLFANFFSGFIGYSRGKWRRKGGIALLSPRAGKWKK